MAILAEAILAQGPGQNLRSAMALSLPSDALPPGKASILFWASWHEPSVQMKEVVEALAEDVTFKIHIADPEERPNAAAAAEIKSVPAIIFLHNGRVWGRIDGADPAKYVSKSEEFAISSLLSRA